MVLVIVIAIFAIIGFVVYKSVQLKSIQIVNSVEINAPMDVPFNMVGDQNNFHKWSPFLHKDLLLKYSIEEAEGFVGTQLTWTGGKDNKDLGCQTVVKATSPTFVGIRCDIQKPFPSVSTFDYAFIQSGNKAIVKQDFRMESSLVSALFLWLFGVKKEIDANNKLGLDLLKKASEHES